MASCGFNCHHTKQGARCQVTAKEKNAIIRYPLSYSWIPHNEIGPHMHEVTGSSPVTPTTLKSPVNIGRNDVCGVFVLAPRKVPSGHLVATFAGHLLGRRHETHRPRYPPRRQNRLARGRNLPSQKADGRGLGLEPIPLYRRANFNLLACCQTTKFFWPQKRIPQS